MRCRINLVSFEDINALYNPKNDRKESGLIIYCIVIAGLTSLSILPVGDIIQELEANLNNTTNINDALKHLVEAFSEILDKFHLANSKGHDTQPTLDDMLERLALTVEQASNMRDHLERESFPSYISLIEQTFQSGFSVHLLNLTRPDFGTIFDDNEYLASIYSHCPIRNLNYEQLMGELLNRTNEIRRELHEFGRVIEQLHIQVINIERIHEIILEYNFDRLDVRPRFAWLMNILLYANPELHPEPEDTMPIYQMLPVNDCYDRAQMYHALEYDPPYYLIFGYQLIGLYMAIWFRLFTIWDVTPTLF